MNVVECKKFHLAQGLSLKFTSRIWSFIAFVEKMLKDMYKLELPPNIKVRPTFYVSSSKIV